MDRKQSYAPIDSVLRHLRMSGTFYCRGQFESPWGVLFPQLPAEGRFHLVTDGRAIVYGPSVPTMTLEPGDFVLLPKGAGHAIADRMGSPLTPYEEISPEFLSQRFARYKHGGNGPGTRLICVSVRFEDTIAESLISLLPAAIHVNASSPDRKWIDRTVRFIAAEARSLRAGSDTIITRLADVLVLQTIRWWVENESAMPTGWLAAIRDRHIGRVLVLLHRQPEHPWTLASLAKAAGMSRSTLASRFRELMDDSVMRYLAGVRMQLALASLKDGRVDIGRVAERVGYQSESAFNRAFRRHVGRPPGATRTALARAEVKQPTTSGARRKRQKRG